MNQEWKGYAIATEPRSGSSFLQQILRSTGAHGNSREWLSRSAVRAEIRRDPERAVERLIAASATPNQVYGLKFFSNQVDLCRGAAWMDRLPGLAFIHLEREDLLGQAISLTKAVQTGRFATIQKERRSPSYSRAGIARQLAGIAGNQGRWRAYFARNGLRPLRISYEQVAADPQQAVDRIGRAIGLEGGVAIDLAKVTIGVQRDELSDEWRERFLSESRDLDIVDSLVPAQVRASLSGLWARVTQRGRTADPWAR